MEQGGLVRGLDETIIAPATTVAERKPVVARPFVKWVGGKGAIASVVAAHLPDRIPQYYELFTGGGALFYHLRKRIQFATLADSNLELMIAYRVIQKDLSKLIYLLSQHAGHHSKDYYYETRNKHDLTDPIEIAARFIYLNKTCYNGLYRVNRQGRFNSPIGSYTNPTICDEQNLAACHVALRGMNIVPYQADQFSGARQEELMHCAIEWYKRGCKVVISNSDTEYIRQLYEHKPFVIHEIRAPRSVNCKGNGRGSITELLIIAE